MKKHLKTEKTPPKGVSLVMFNKAIRFWRRMILYNYCRINGISVYFRVLFVVNNLAEVGLEGSAAYQAAIDIGHSEKLRS